MHIKKRHCQVTLLYSALILIVSSSIFCGSSSVLAAQTVVFKYKIFRESLTVDELSRFAETGELSNSLRVNFALARKQPTLIRQYLTAPVKVNPVLLDRLLNTPMGNLLLDELSQVIHTPSRHADRQALRSAMVLSASDNQQIRLIEIIENYPTPVAEVDGERLEIAYRQLTSLQAKLENIFGF